MHARAARSTRFRAEEALAVLFAAGIIIAGAAVLTFVYTISPVHTDPGAVPSMVAAAPAERYSGAVEEATRLARSLLVAENLLRRRTWCGSGLRC